MIKLIGFQVSNYYNMVKYVLLEKGIDFEEVSAMPSQEGDFKAKSPMGKVPCIETEHGYLSETSAILAYIETLQPSPSLFGSDPWQGAKIREVCKEIELYIELQGRRHYPEIFFGEGRNEAAVTEAKPVIENGLKALKHNGSFSPFICGEFSAADIVAAHTFIYAAPVCQAVYGWDIVAEVPGLQEAIDATNAREAGAKVAADHGAAMKAFQEANG